MHARGLTQLVADEVSAAVDRADRKTLGQLLNDVRREVNMPHETEAALQRALQDRNYLFHWFFVNHDVDFESNPGRRNMIAELRAMASRFQEIDRLVDAVWIPQVPPQPGVRATVATSRLAATATASEYISEVPALPLAHLSASVTHSPSSHRESFLDSFRQYKPCYSHKGCTRDLEPAGFRGRRDRFDGP